MKLIYTPVFFGHLRYSWWAGECGMTHPYGLISAGDITSGVNAQKTFKKPKGIEELYVDSGGYQMITQGMYFTPEQVAEWQENVGADVKIILDHPPRKLVGVGMTERLEGPEFVKCLDETIDNTKRMIATYKQSTKVYGALHGKDSGQIDMWFSKLSKVYDFDGWAISIARKAAEPLEYKIKLLGEAGIKRIHIFGTANFMVIAKCARYMRDYGVEYCTFDSTGYIATKFSNVFYPTIENMMTWFSRAEGKHELRLACDCPVCRILKPNEYLDQGNEVEFGYIASIHNIYHIQRVAEVVAELVKYDDTYKELLNIYKDIKLPILTELGYSLSDFAEE